MDQAGTVTPGDEVPVSPQKQRELYKVVGYKIQKKGETWYPISTKWHKSWTAYTVYDKKDEDIEGGLGNLHLRDIPRPGPIDNSELVDPEDSQQLKKGLEEHTTHEWVHSEQWNLLYSWYGGGPAFPRQVCERGTYNTEKYINMYPKFLRLVDVNRDGTYDLTKFRLESFPEQHTWQEVVNQFETDNNNNDSDKPSVHLWLPFEPMKKIYPVSTSKGVVVKLEDFEKENPNRYVEVPDDQLKYSLNDVVLPKDVCILVEKKRTSSDNGVTPSGGASTEEQTNNNTSQNDSNNTNNGSDKAKSNENDSEEQKFSWPLVKGPSKWKNFEVGDVLDAQDNHKKWYEAFVRFVQKGENDQLEKVAIHFIGWSENWDEWISIGNYERLALRNTHTGGKPYRPQPQRSYNYSSSYSSSGSSSWYGYSSDEGTPEQKGVVGLRNLGNTCFMNSTIQCLAQSPHLTEYFLKDNFVHHINYNNPLGWKGKVAQAWASLLKDMFSNKYKVLAPREFKDAIGEVAPRFLGYSQQDSQELLSFLLDGLHEDLNQIREKPVTESVESNGRPDTVVANEAWRTYLKRNQSIIVDLLQGQYKSRVECPSCDRVSITFDPYMFLSVPLPTERYKTLEITYVGSNTNEPPTVYGIKMLKLADFAMLKKAIGKQFDVAPGDLHVCDVWKGKIHKEMSDREMIAEINPRSDDIVVFHSPTPKETPSAEDKKAVPEKDKETNQDADKDKDKEKDKETENATNGDAPGKKGADEENTNQNGTSNSSRHDDNYSDHRGHLSREPRVVPDFKAFQVIFQTRTKESYSNYSHDETFGMPLFITLPMKRKVTYKEARQKIFEIVKPFLTNKEKWSGSNQDTNTNEKEKSAPFTLQAEYDYRSVLDLEDKDDAYLPLEERSFKFVANFRDRTEYNEEICEREKRKRHESAPAPKSESRYDDDDRSSGAPVELAACINAFTEEEILDENDAWFCNKCSDFKCAKKKMDLWSSPDLLIIHLKRFSFTREWRDRINTVVQFPLEGLDLSPWIVSEENKVDAVYDLYGISNHMGGMGGGHYTAYAKNLDNAKWYQLNDSHTMEVHNPQSMISSAAYVLYYKRRTTRQRTQRASLVLIPDSKSVQTQSTDATPNKTGGDASDQN